MITSKTKPTNKRTLASLSAMARRVSKADTARLLDVDGTLFAIVGFNRNTKQDEGFWQDESGNRIDFDYVHEQTIANGGSPKELMASLKKYSMLLALGKGWPGNFNEVMKLFENDRAC